jgi:hypothetical protein
MADLFLARYAKTGEILTRDTLPMVGTRAEWEHLPKTMVGELVPAEGHPAAAGETTPVFGVEEWRPGNTVPRHVYQGATPVATAVTDGYAAQIIEDHNVVHLDNGMPVIRWTNHALCISEGDRQIAFALTMDFARRIVADHNDRLDAGEARLTQPVLRPGDWVDVHEGARRVSGTVKTLGNLTGPLVVEVIPFSDGDAPEEATSHD